MQCVVTSQAGLRMRQRQTLLQALHCPLRGTGGPSSLPTSPAAARPAGQSYSGRTRPGLAGTLDSSWRLGRLSRRTPPSSPTHQIS